MLSSLVLPCMVRVEWGWRRAGAALHHAAAAVGAPAGFLALCWQRTLHRAAPYQARCLPGLLSGCATLQRQLYRSRKLKEERTIIKTVEMGATARRHMLHLPAPACCCGYNKRTPPGIREMQGRNECFNRLLRPGLASPPPRQGAPPRNEVCLA